MGAMFVGCLRVGMGPRSSRFKQCIFYPHPQPKIVYLVPKTARCHAFIEGGMSVMPSLPVPSASVYPSSSLSVSIFVFAHFVLNSSYLNYFILF